MKWPIWSIDQPDLAIPDRLLMGDALAAIARKTGLTNADIDALQLTQDQKLLEPLKFD